MPPDSSGARLPFTADLRTREQYLALVFNGARDMMLLARVEPDVLFRIVSVNRSYVETVRAAGFNLDAEKFAGRTFAESMALYGFDAAAVAELRGRYEQVIRTHQPVEFKEVNQTPAGIFHGRSTITPILDETGDCCHVLYSSQDVTERVRAEQALRESEEKFATAFRMSPDIMSISDYETGRYLEVNEAHEKIFGFSRAEAIGRSPAELGILPEQAARDGILRQMMAQDGQVRDFRVEACNRRGDRLIIFLSAEVIELGGRKCILRHSRDITATVQAEQALRHSEEKFAKAFRATPDAIAITDLETGVFLEANGSYERIFGAPAATFMGQSTVESGFYRDPADRARFLEQIRVQGSVHNVELRCFNQQREPIVVLYSGEAIEMNGRKCLVSVIHDITARKQTEQALGESEEKFAMVFRSSPDAISVHEQASGRYLDVNPGYQRLFGYAREEVIGRSPLELGIWVDPAERDAFLGVLQRDGLVRSFQARFRLRGGDVRMCEISSEAVEIGGRAHNVSILRDVTQRRQAEQALRESEEKFAKAFRASPDAISISDRATGRIMDVNEGFERLSGYGRGELIGHTAEERGIWTTPEDRRRMLQELQLHGRVNNLQVRARSRTGELREFLMSVEGVEIGGRACLVIVGHDISKRLLAEAALRESEEKFAMAFRSSPHPLIITELPTGRYVDVNLGFERITGYSRDEVIGRTSLDINIWDNLDDRDELMRRIQRDGKVRDLELRFRQKYGGILVTRCAFETIELAGRPCMLSTIEDITEQRRVEEQHLTREAQLRQNQKLEALGTLAGGIAHDFNNILTAIIVNQELAAMDATEPEAVRQRLAEISRASNRAKELVRQILTFSRQQQHERLQQQLQPIVAEALGLLRSSLPATIAMDQYLAPDAPAVRADASQIHQVVMNLCTNAAHAMHHQSGRITVRLHARTLDAAACLGRPGLAPGNYAHLMVADTGHGMEAAVLARVFEPFFTTKGPGEGTGLGLPVVHGIMQSHEGAIFVQSQPEVGTTFDLYFPEAKEHGVARAAEDMAIVPGRGESVLLVDDEEAICGAIGAMLRKIGYRVQAFTDPRLALDRFQAAPVAFDLLLTDRTMPHFSGPQLIARMRAASPGLRVLLMSGLTSAPESGAGVEGIHPLVAKPLDIAQLSRAVRQALQPQPPS